ncbi:hypothetical protein ACFLUD_04305 [Chloroflexota bacterium]
MKQPEMDNKQEYLRLLDLFARVDDANEGFSSSDITHGARLLAGKFIVHALTILHLLNDTKVQLLPSLPPMKISFVALASIEVLTIAVMEAFLIFHYVFFAPTTAEEKDYRYWSYKAAGITEWQKLLESISGHEQEKAEEKKALDELRNKLESNKVFQSLDKQKKRILKGEWRLKSWREIAIDAGFSKMLASQYRYLSGSARSSNLSNLRMEQALINKEPEEFIQGSINTMNIVIANMIRKYCALFPRARDVLTKDLEGSNLVKQYFQIGRELDKYMGT